MKYFTLYLFGLSLAAIVFVSATQRSSGSPGGKSGSPMDGANCTACHGGTAKDASWITSDIPETGYDPGQTYTLEINPSHASFKKFGFELTAENGSSKVGTFALLNASQTKLFNQNQAVTHTSSGTSADKWMMNWTAPEKGTGSVGFYAAVVAANGNGGNSGDDVYVSNLMVAEHTSTNTKDIEGTGYSIYPNPSQGQVFVQAANPITQITVYNLSGNVVWESSNLGNLQHSLPELRNGVYFVKSVTTENEFVSRILVQD